MANPRNAALAVLLLALPALARAGDDRQLLTANPARSNVLIVLDTSGSMVGTTDVDLVSEPASIDDPDAKIAIAKRALKDLLNHEDTINFGFAHFKQNFSGSPLTINGQSAVNSTSVVKQWLYYAGAQASGAANPWSGTATDAVRAGAPLQFGSYVPFGLHGCNTYYPLFGSGQSPSTISTGATPSSVTKGFGTNASDRWIVYYYPSGGFQGVSSRRLKMQIASGGGSYGDPTLRVTETVQSKSGAIWSDTATVYTIVYSVASDSRYPMTDPDFGWDGSFIEHSYTVNCDASGSASYQLEQYEQGSFNSPGNSAQWEYFAGSTLKPRVPVRCDTCADNRPSILHLLRPAEKLISYDKTAGVYKLLEDPLQALSAFGNTPLAASLSASLNYFTQDAQFTADTLKACRKNFVILITDGFETAGGNPCTVSTSLGSARIPVFVVSFGSGANPATNACIATNSGGHAYAATDEEGLNSALADIFSRVEVTSAFSAASVPSVQVEQGSTAYLASFVPHQLKSIWSGHLRAYAIDPTTGLPPVDPNSGIPLQDRPDDSSARTRRPIWDAGRVLGATSALTTVNPGDTATQVGSPAVTVWPGRKLVWGSQNGSQIPNTRYDFDPSLPDPQWSVLKGLLSETDNAATQTLIRFIRGDRDTQLKNSIFPDLVVGNDKRSYQFVDKADYPAAAPIPAYSHKLGDIFHSDPIVVSAPLNFSYLRRGIAGYQTFAQANSKRRRIVFVGANDGFVHAFDAGVWGRDSANFPGTWDAGSGREIFGFAPRAALGPLKSLFVSFETEAPVAYLADGTMTSEDVYTDNEFASTPNPANRAWRSVLIGGLRQGGSAVFALDVTQPDLLKADGTVQGNADAAPACLNGATGCGGTGKHTEYPRVLWEFTDAAAPAMGQTWSRPVLGRMEFYSGVTASGPAPAGSNNFHPCTADGTRGCEDKYVAILGGGFDPSNANTVGTSLYILDAETGTAIYKGTSGKDSSGTAVSFGSIPGQPGVGDINDDAYLDVAYVGDVKGQLWKLDLTPDLSGTTTRGKLASGKASYFPMLLFDAGTRSGCTSPCSRPFYMEPTVILTGISSGAVKTLGVAIGSGQRADLLDRTSNTQRFYLIVDLGVTRSESDLVGFNVNDPVPGGSLANGWFLRYPTDNEKTTTMALAQAGYLVFTTFRLQTDGGDPCKPSGFSRLYAMKYSDGSAVPGQARYEEISNPGVALGMSSSINLKGEVLTIIQEQGSGLMGESFGLSVSTFIRDWKER